MLLKAAARLQAIHEDWNGRAGELDDALLYNRKLWSVFLTSLTDQSHPLPREVRQNLANLGVFVMNQTLSIMTEPRREKLGALVNINREIAAGLQGRG